jgi:CheY-like chemotaxis protein
LKTMASDAPSAPPVSRHALVADDDREMRALMASVLKEAGFDVVELGDGHALLEHLRSAPCPALIVTDLQMPHFTGMAALRHIRRLGLAVPVILVTAFGNPRIHLNAARLGAAAVLDKPFSLITLRALALRLTAGNISLPKTG